MFKIASDRVRSNNKLIYLLKTITTNSVVNYCSYLDTLDINSINSGTKIIHVLVPELCIQYILYIQDNKVLVLDSHLEPEGYDVLRFRSLSSILKRYNSSLIDKMIILLYIGFTISFNFLFKLKLKYILIMMWSLAMIFNLIKIL